MINQTLALDQSSYRSEVTAAIATNPDVIFTEADPQTDAAYLSQLQQLHGLIPVIGTEPTAQPPWAQAVARVGATGVAIELRLAKAVPLVAEAARVGVADDEAGDAANDREGVRLLAGQAAGIDRVEIRARMQASVADRTAQPCEQGTLHVGAPWKADIRDEG